MDSSFLLEFFSEKEIIFLIFSIKKQETQFIDNSVHALTFLFFFNKNISKAEYFQFLS